MQQNRQRKHNAKGYGYDTRNRQNPYQAHRKYMGRLYHLGMFGTPCGAKMAWNNFFINKGETI